jgi:hypothetical protein
MFAAVVLSTSQWVSRIETRRDIGLTQLLTLDDIGRGFMSALSYWSWSPSHLLFEEFPSIVLLMLIAVPILHRFRFEGYRRGLVIGFWLHVPWQVLVLLVVAFITFETERLHACQARPSRSMRRSSVVSSCWAFCLQLEGSPFAVIRTARASNVAIDSPADRAPECRSSALVRAGRPSSGCSQMFDAPPASSMNARPRPSADHRTTRSS